MRSKVGRGGWWWGVGGKEWKRKGKCEKGGEKIRRQEEGQVGEAGRQEVAG